MIGFKKFNLFEFHAFYVGFTVIMKALSLLYFLFNLHPYAGEALGEGRVAFLAPFAMLLIPQLTVLLLEVLHPFRYGFTRAFLLLSVILGVVSISLLEVGLPIELVQVPRFLFGILKEILKEVVFTYF